MGEILIIHGSDFSHNRIDKVDITKQVKKNVDSQKPTSYSSSIVSLKNNNQ